MKTIMFAVYALAASLAFAGDISERKAAAVGRGTLVIRETRSGNGEFPTVEVFRVMSGLDGGQEKLIWLPRKDAQDMVELLKKFGDWVDVARKNNVTSLTKEIGKVSGISVTFIIERENVVLKYVVRGNAIIPKGLDSRDLKTVLGLFEQLPTMDAEIAPPVKPATKDSLFK